MVFAEPSCLGCEHLNANGFSLQIPALPVVEGLQIVQRRNRVGIVGSEDAPLNLDSLEREGLRLREPPREDV